MSCNTMELSREAREAREKALTELRDDLETGRRKLVTNILTGTITVSGWKDTTACKSGWCEGCAIRELEVRGTAQVKAGKASTWAERSLKAVGVRAGVGFVALHHRGHNH